ncbi:MAG TPA: hypothetical protein VMH02_05075 [Verrucomicrobiae bacterium]|nr:hypothetical protein [Verrucomicrobiae bacterium]
MLRTLAAFAAVLALSTGAAGAQNVSRYGIKIISCTVANDGTSTKGIAVSYVNARPVPAVQVNFFVRYHGQTGIVIDKGSFTQGAVVTHTLTNSFMGYAYEGPTPNLCRVNKVVRADGSVTP